MTRRLRQFILEGVLILICIVLAWRAPGFLKARNLLNILNNVSMEGIIAFGMTMVIIAGEIDLGVGSMVAFAGCITAWITQWLTSPPLNWHTPAAVIVAAAASMIAGVTVGCISGSLRVWFRVPTFISTLAWLTALRGAAGLITNGFPLTPFPDWYNFIGAGHVWKIPFPAIIFVVIFAAFQFIMNFTIFGRSVYAVGGNAEAARLSGIPVSAVKVSVMAIVAALAVFAGIMLSSQNMAGSDRSGQGWELDVIAAVIIGGTDLMGGAGRVWGTLIGVIFLGVLVNGMTLLNISEYWQMVVEGVLILAAVLVNTSAAERT